MRMYTVSQLARMSGVTPRTLHHYDQIGLLSPTRRSAAGYRQYGPEDLYRLQQILLYRELELPLEEIRRLLDDPGFDLVESLRAHRVLLDERAQRLERLMQTVDKTIARLTEDDMTLTDDELYAGLTKEQRERYPREAREMYDPEMVKLAEQRVRKMSKAEWERHKAASHEFTRGLAALTDRDPGDPQVQTLIARHHAWIEVFYPANADLYRGLGELYTSNPEFRATYEKYGSGLADFMQAAMNVYAERNLA